jgi:uncharacterized membrane-anchored protein
MRMKLTHAIFAAIAVALAAPALADGPGSAGPDVAAPPVRAAPVRAAPVEAAPEGRSGTIALMDGAFSLNVPRGYRFYSAEEAYGYMQRTSAAAPSGTVLGLLAPASANVRAPDTWATVVSYDAIGYVRGETASGLADANFEADVRTARASKQRRFEGFAAPAVFTAETPELVWAERVAAPGSQGPDLRYEQKMPARKGVAALTSIGSLDQMPLIEAAATEMKAMLSFSEGNRYADFAPASDQVSAYTVPGLVTGLSAAQLAEAALTQAAEEKQSGFGGLSAWFPWIALGVVALAGLGYMLTRKRATPDDDDDDEEDADEAPAKA